MSAHAEKAVEDHLKKTLKAQHLWYTKFFANSFTNKGVPDILACYQGKLLALEIKKPIGGQPTPIQLQNLKQIAKNGGLAFVTSDRNLIAKLDVINQNLTHFHNTHRKLYLSAPKMPDNLQVIKTTPQQSWTPKQAKELWQQYEKEHPKAPAHSILFI